MLAKQFKFKRNNDKSGFQWTAHSEVERPGFYPGFTAVGETLPDVKGFAALVRNFVRVMPTATRRSWCIETTMGRPGKCAYGSRCVCFDARARQCGGGGVKFRVHGGETHPALRRRR